MRKNFSVFLSILFIWPLFFTGRYSAVDMGKIGNWSIGSSGGQQFVNLWGNSRRNGTYLYLPIQEQIVSVSVLAKNISSGIAPSPLIGVSDNVQTLRDSIETFDQSWRWYLSESQFYADTLFILFVNDQWQPGVLDVNVAIDSIIVETVAWIDTFEADSIRVLWYQNKEPDLDRYRIYFGYASRQYKWFWETRDTTFLFAPVKDTTQYLTVTAIDTADNESGYSRELAFYVKSSISKVDSVKPGPPVLDKIVLYGSQIDSIVIYKKR